MADPTNQEKQKEEVKNKEETKAKEKADAEANAKWSKSPEEILGFDKEELAKMSPEEAKKTILKARNQASLLYHPDKNPDRSDEANNKIKDINDLADTLIKSYGTASQKKQAKVDVQPDERRQSYKNTRTEYSHYTMPADAKWNKTPAEMLGVDEQKARKYISDEELAKVKAALEKARENYDPKKHPGEEDKAREALAKVEEYGNSLIKRIEARQQEVVDSVQNQKNRAKESKARGQEGDDDKDSQLTQAARQRRQSYRSSESSNNQRTIMRSQNPNVVWKVVLFMLMLEQHAGKKLDISSVSMMLATIMILQRAALLSQLSSSKPGPTINPPPVPTK